MPTPDDMTPFEHKLRARAFCAALGGLLADPEDHNDLTRPGETCVQCVVRLAWEHADEAIVQYRRRYGL